MFFSIYIHLPFCKRKCNYCDFTSFANKEDLIDEYIDVIASEAKQSFFLIEKEIASSLSLLAKTPLIIKTIYIGGGTPSLLSHKQLKKILDPLIPACRQARPWPLDTELSLECNPGTVTLEKLKAYRDLGINRLSIGAQSFDDNELKILGRIHNAKEIYTTVENARKAGFDNINLDLMFALPNQTLDNWKQTLNKATALNVEHLSTYNLQIEEGTPFWEKYKNQPEAKPARPAGGRLGFRKSLDNRDVQSLVSNLPDEEIEAQMYEYTMDYLPAKGYKQYEISNFAKPGLECKHNIVYWKNGNYLGLGVSAASHINGKRHENTKDLEEYLNKYKCRDRACPCPKLPDNHKGCPYILNSPKNEISETIFMNLRLLEGINKQEFQERFNHKIEDLYNKEIGDLVKAGLMENTKTHLKLTPRGLLLANEVFKAFL